MGNPGQSDVDLDRHGDVCDNCMTDHNPFQRDDDTDGIGNVCDLCPEDADPGQTDWDGDGAGDACDCQPLDPTDLAPRDLGPLDVQKQGTGSVLLSWSPDPAADAHSVLRGELGGLAAGSYGDCLHEGIDSTSYLDSEVPAVGTGFFYLVQAQNFDCGLGSLGFGSAEEERVSLSGTACAGHPHNDSYAEGESTILGTPSGSFADTLASDGVVQSITEERTSGSPFKRISLLEHHWTIPVAAGSRTELHVQGFRTTSSDGDDFGFELSTDGGSSWNPIPLAGLPLADDHVDLVALLPSPLPGVVTIRVTDTDRTPGNDDLDSVSVDELFVRSIP
jgi:hypothetical protein